MNGCGIGEAKLKDVGDGHGGREAMIAKLATREVGMAGGSKVEPGFRNRKLPREPGATRST